jgi:hypothetical protein
LLDEAHSLAYSIHRGSTKMYLDLKTRYWWKGIKKDIAQHVAHASEPMQSIRNLWDCCNLYQYPNGNGRKHAWILWSDYLDSQEEMTLFGS